MKCRRLILFIAIVFPFMTSAAGTVTRKPNAAKKVVVNNKGHAGPLVAAIKDYEDKGDDLALRALVKKIAKAQPGYGDWIRVRQMLQRRPSTGYGLLYAWEKVPFVGNKNAATITMESKVNKYLENADDMMSQGKFQGAFTAYQSAAKVLKKELASGHRENHLLYENVLQSMARSLFGAGRFDESLTVYDWITRNYPHYRQVLFEKMWTAFRGNHADIALGAIASQRSTYFSDYMEPESYLVQLYIYKKLCRTDEVHQLQSDISLFRRNLIGNKYTWQDWAKSDLETYGLLRLTELEVKDNGGPISVREKQFEQEQIKKSLVARFDYEKKRIMRELNQVLAYSYLAVGAKFLKLKDNELNPDRLRKSGNEVWPVEDAEDWLDELGNHLYIGESQCEVK
jgi:tetratricopeptide (TPR) repeat protein